MCCTYEVNNEQMLTITTTMRSIKLDYSVVVSTLWYIDTKLLNVIINFIALDIAIVRVYMYDT